MHPIRTHDTFLDVFAAGYWEWQVLSNITVADLEDSVDVEGFIWVETSVGSQVDFQACWVHRDRLAKYDVEMLAQGS